MDFLEKAKEIAFHAHNGQYDRYGQPYILHPQRVMKMGRTKPEKILGILHDVVEKSDVTVGDIYGEGFPNTIVKALIAISQEDGEDYDDYITRVAGDPLAVAVKLNDLADNMDLRRYPALDEEDIARLKKYHGAYLRLKSLPVKTTFAEARRKNPNAFKAWLPSEDEELEKLLCDGIPVEELAVHFGRSTLSIEMRMLILGIPDKYGSGFAPSDRAYKRYRKQLKANNK